MLNFLPSFFFFFGRLETMPIVVEIPAIVTATTSADTVKVAPVDVPADAQVAIEVEDIADKVGNVVGDDAIAAAAATAAAIDGLVSFTQPVGGSQVDAAMAPIADASEAAVGEKRTIDAVVDAGDAVAAHSPVEKKACIEH